MKFKMIVAFVPDVKLDPVLVAAREAGATGSTVITSARGEGREPAGRFLGLEVVSHRNLVFWIVDSKISAHVLNTIADVGRFEEDRGAGIACQIDVEAVAGLMRQFNLQEGDEGQSSP